MFYTYNNELNILDENKSVLESIAIEREGLVLKRAGALLIYYILFMLGQIFQVVMCIDAVTKLHSSTDLEQKHHPGYWTYPVQLCSAGIHTGADPPSQQHPQAGCCRSAQARDTGIPAPRRTACDICDYHYYEFVRLGICHAGLEAIQGIRMEYLQEDWCRYCYAQYLL